ncbi:glycoside hydrolase family 2 [Microbacterium petrolearium]
MTLTSPRATALPAPSSVPIPRAEYPRPDLDRSARWLPLNGVWQFEADDAPDTITVPFAWESAASGVKRAWLEHGTYRRRIAVPEGWGDARLILCFGAVHHRAIVRIDDQLVGEHVGGYESFEIDITDALAGRAEATLSVEVFAPADKRAIPHGKQRSIPRDDYDGVSFTPTSGIWQSVWLEGRGRTYASRMAVRGDSLHGFDIDLGVAGDAPGHATVTVTVLGTDDEVTVRSDALGRASARLDLREPRPWSPAQPHLYRLQVITRTERTTDTVVVTAGLRRIEARDGALFLNGERLYVRGVLDQGYWPDTGPTAPTAEALLHDLDLAANLGYNLVRKHLKFEEPLWLHEADRRGMLVWAEPACPSRYSPAAAASFAAQLPAMVERDGNHPSIVIWGLYNEEWGLDWDIPGSSARAAAAKDAYEALRALDDSRPIVDNSGWSHVRTDIADWHYYEPDLGTWRDAVAGLAGGERTSFPVRLGPDFIVDKDLWARPELADPSLPLLNSEYGEGFTSLERGWHLRWETQELRRHDKIAGYVYTELADVEHEMAGLLTAHRHRKDIGGADPADINAETTLVIDLVPLAAGADIRPPHAAFPLAVAISHHGADAIRGTVHACWIAANRPLPAAPRPEAARSPLVTAEPFRLSPETTVHVPAHPGPGRLGLYFVDISGAVRARAFIDAAEVEPPNRRGARAGEFVGWEQPGLPDE